MDETVRDAALRYAQERYPMAELVVVAGSSAGVRKARSDIDLLVIGPDDMFSDGTVEASHTDRVRGELFEVFACTPDAFRDHARAGVAQFRRLAEFVLLANGRWIGSGRWLLRRLSQWDQAFAEELGNALADSDTPTLEQLTLTALEPYGGRLMEGHSRGKP